MRLLQGLNICKTPTVVLCKYYYCRIRCHLLSYITVDSLGSPLLFAHCFPCHCHLTIRLCPFPTVRHAWLQIHLQLVLSEAAPQPLASSFPWKGQLPSQPLASSLPGQVSSLSEAASLTEKERLEWGGGAVGQGHCCLRAILQLVLGASWSPVAGAEAYSLRKVLDVQKPLVKVALHFITLKVYPESYKQHQAP